MLFKDGGPFMYLLLLAVPASALLALVWTVLSLLKIRVPLPVWLFAPVSTIGVGLLGTALGMNMALEAIAHASAEMKSTLAAAGYSVALYTTLVGWGVASMSFVAAAWAAGVSLLRAESEDPWDFKLPALLLGGGLLLGVVATAIGIFYGDGPMPILVGLVALMAAPSLSIGSLRTSMEPESRTRLAEGRLVVGVLAMAAPLSMAACAWVSGKVRVMEAVAYASAEMKQTLLGAGMALQDSTLWVGLVATLGTGLLAAVMVAPLLRHISGGRLALHLGGALVLLVPLMAVGGLTASQGSVLQGVIDSTFRMPSRDDLELLYVGKAKEPAHRSVDVVVKRLEVLVHGRPGLRFEVVPDPETGEEVVILPADEQVGGRIPGLGDAFEAAELGPVIVLQAHSETPVRLMAPVLVELKAAGVREVQLVVFSPKGDAVVALPSLPEDRPDATLEELLADNPHPAGY